MKINSELMKGSTPLLVLKLLSMRDMYGYEMIKTLEILSNDTFHLKQGSLYPLLHLLPISSSLKFFSLNYSGQTS